MPERRRLELDEDQKRTLEEMRDHHRKAYLRERAGALLKVAGGMSVNEVAQRGLLKRRHPDRVREWLDRYEAQGIGGLYIRAGRGRKGAFPPRGTEALARMDAGGVEP